MTEPTLREAVQAWADHVQKLTAHMTSVLEEHHLTALNLRLPEMIQTVMAATENAINQCLVLLDKSSDIKFEVAEARIAPRLWQQQDKLAELEDGYGDQEVNVEAFKENCAYGNLRFVPPGEGNLVSSAVDLANDVYMPILDLDRPHVYVPSSTPGHAHLYLNVKMSFVQQEALINMLVAVGVLGKGSATQIQAYGVNSVRRPGLTKKKERAEWEAQKNKQRERTLSVPLDPLWEGEIEDSPKQGLLLKQEGLGSRLRKLILPRKK